MIYKKISMKEFSVYDYSIVPLRQEDILNIKKWRNEQMTILRQSRLLTDEDQLSYYSNVVKPTFTEDHPKIMLFSYLLHGELIGYGGLTNIDWINSRAEISYLVATERSLESNEKTYEEDFSSFLTLMKMVAFQELALNRLYTETFNIRPLHISILEQNGFAYEGTMRQHVIIDGKYVDSLLHGCLKG